MPTLVAAYGLYTDKSQFKKLAVPFLDPEEVNARYAASFVMNEEPFKLLAKYIKMMQVDGKKLST